MSCSHGSIRFLSLPQAWLCSMEGAALLAWELAKNDACGDPPPQLYPFQSGVCSRELQKCYYVVLSGYVGCILSRAGIKFCHHCPWAICHCAASSFQSRLLLLSVLYHLIIWNLKQDSQPWKKKDNPFSSVVGNTVLEAGKMQPSPTPQWSCAFLLSVIAVFASAAFQITLGVIRLFPLDGSSWWKVVSCPEIFLYAQTSNDNHFWGQKLNQQVTVNKASSKSCWGVFIFILLVVRLISDENGFLEWKFLKKRGYLSPLFFHYDYYLGRAKILTAQGGLN